MQTTGGGHFGRQGIRARNDVSKSCLLAALAVLLCSSAPAWPLEGLTLQNDQATYSKDGLFLRVLLAQSPENLVKEWSKPSLPETPVLATRTRFQRGEIVFPAILYATNTLDPEGKAKITYGFCFRRPDGSIYEESSGLTVVDGPPPSGIGLFKEMTALRIEDDDPLGEYRLDVRITDHVRDTVVEIPFTFHVEEKGSRSPSLIDPPGDLGIKDRPSLLDRETPPAASPNQGKMTGEGLLKLPGGTRVRTSNDQKD